MDGDDTGLLTVMVISEDGVFTVRRRARDVAELVGLDHQDGVRIATALGEVGRDALGWWSGAMVTFSVRALPAPALAVRVQASPTAGVPVRPVPTMTAPDGAGLAAAARLIDDVAITEDASAAPAVTLLKRLPAGRWAPGPDDVERLRAELAGYGPASPYDELRTQNTELLAALDTLITQQRSLVELNAELEETNRGVMAMYTQLSEELEETNRGVVALYAELEDKGAQIEEASEAKSRFLASVSHELRSPVNSILGLTRLLAEPDGDPLTGEQRRQVELIAATADSLLSLVNGLLDLAKAESGRIEPDVTDVDLRAVFAALRATIAPLLTGTEVRLDIDDPATDVHLASDEHLVTHILRNLLTNAVKYTERGRVTMRATRSASARHIELTVTDTGIGIAAEDRTRVFEDFFQVPNPLQARARGTGLGLPYVRRVTELLGGDIHLDSEVGRGTQITVRLPVEWSAPLASEVTPPRGVPAVGPVQVGTVLVVDDDDTFRQVLRGLLRGRAERIIEASDGDEAINLLRATRCDLLLLDLHMPTVGGREVLAHLAADATLGSPAVVVVTSFDPDTIEPPLPGPAPTVMTKADLNAATIDAAIHQALAGGP